MKKAAFILYVGCVLAFSAFARAEVSMPFSKASFKSQAAIQIENVYIDGNTLELKIAGFLPNPCTQMPSATLVQDIENSRTLIVRLSSPVPTDVCVSRTIDFSAIVSLPVLAQTSRIQLDPNAEYTVKAEGSDFAILVRGSELLRVPGFIAF